MPDVREPTHGWAEQKLERTTADPLLPDPDPRERSYTIISVDDHLVEPRDLFDDRMNTRSTAGRVGIINGPISAVTSQSQPTANCMDALVALLRDDVVLSMPPYDLWLQGTDNLVGWFTGQGIGCTGSKLIPIAVNGTAGFGSYRMTRPGLWEPFAIQVIDVVDGKIVGHHNFLYPEQFADFGLPPRIEA